MAQKKRAQGGGRTANSEPRQQIFKEFNGCNFELSPRDFTLGKEVDQEQSDLQMNYIVVQNNVEVASNKTLQSRNNIVKLFDAPVGHVFTGPVLMAYGGIYVATVESEDETRGHMFHDYLHTRPIDNDLVEMHYVDNTGSNPGHVFTDIEYIDHKIIGMADDRIWLTDDIDGQYGNYLHNVKKIPNPQDHTQNIQDGIPITPEYDWLEPRGTLLKSTIQTPQCPYRVSLAVAYVSELGPTKVSNQLIFYTSEPPENWHTGMYMHIQAKTPKPWGDITAENAGIKAVELFYTSGNASNLQFLGRKDIGSDMKLWGWNWYGYLDVTSMWPASDLIAPTENYTQGVTASQVGYIDSRVYFWGTYNQPYRLWVGGNSGNLFNVSPGTGGGFIDIEPGTDQEIKVVTKYKTQSGNSIVTMLCNSPNSHKEQRYNLVENQISLSNEQSMKSWQAEQVAGAVGARSFNSAIACADGLYSVSRYGLALTTMTMEYNSQIQTNYVSDQIKPAFTSQENEAFEDSSIIEADGVIYMSFCKPAFENNNIIFCYDINLKAWWTMTLDTNESIIRLFNVDVDTYREGVGIITEKHIYLYPLTDSYVKTWIDDDRIEHPNEDTPEIPSTSQFVIQTGELATQQPQQQWQYVSQLEFRFDYFLGDMVIELTGIDQFGRKVTTKKTISHDETMYNLREYMRVDLRLQSYQIRMTGSARFRMTHFIARVYLMSNKQGIVWGFDDSQSFRSFGDIHPTFKDYNDIKQAIIP